MPPRVSPPGFRPGLWSTGPTARPGTGERPVGAPDHSQGRNPWRVDDRGETPGGGRVPDAVEYGRAGYVPFGPCGPVGGGRMPLRPRVSPWAMVHRAYSPAGYVHSGPFGYPASFPASAEAVRRRPEAEAVLIGISVRLHLDFASGFLSVCEGKGLYVRRACQYVILRISSRPCTWPECSFYRRPIYCLSAPYASRGVPEIHEP